MDHPSASSKSFGLSVAIIVGGGVIALAMYLTRATPPVPSASVTIEVVGAAITAAEGRAL